MTSPFLKAVGGKGGVLGQIEPHLPPEFSGYGETFLGGGALYFSLLPSVGNVVLADSNARLIDAYLGVRDDVDGVIEALREFRYPDSYYAVRDEFNARTGTLAQRAAMFIYLSKSCYNGRYRVNRRG